MIREVNASWINELVTNLRGMPDDDTKKCFVKAGVTAACKIDLTLKDNPSLILFALAIHKLLKHFLNSTTLKCKATNNVNCILYNLF